MAPQDAESKSGAGAAASEGHGLAGHHHKKPFKFHKILETRPVCALLTGCGTLFFLTFLLAVSAALGGDAVLKVSTDVPMYLRDHDTFVHMDSIIVGKEIANAEASTSVPRPQEVASYKLQVVYLRKDGRDVLDASGTDLRFMQALESKIMAAPGYDRFCVKVYPNRTKVSTTGVCQRPLSAVYFYDPAFFRPTHSSYTTPPLCPLDTSVSPPKCTGSPASWDLNNTQLLAASTFSDVGVIPTGMDWSTANVAATTSFWSTYDNNKFTALVEDEGAMVQTTVENLFYRVSDAGFGKQANGGFGGTGKALMTTFQWGLPLPGFDKTSGDQLKEQEDLLGEFLFDSYHELLDDQSEWEDDFVVLWKGDRLMEPLYVQTKLNTNMVLVVGSIVFVLLYISAVTGSLFVGVMGLGQIFLAFPPAILLYRFVFGYAYFGTLNMMAIFIILGIGADDIFVFLDTWDQMKLNMRGQGVQARMSATLRHAGKAMATTSFSTIFAFLANATSSFPAVYTFGVFCAVLVLVNYLYVCFFFPCVVAVRDRYFLKERCCFCCLRPCTRTAKAKTDAPAPDDAPVAVTKPTKPDPAEPTDLGRVPRWFRDWYYVKVLHPYRMVILAAYAVLVVVLVIFAAQIRPDPDAPTLFFPGDNYLEFNDVMMSNFPRQGNPNQVKTQIVFGIKGIERGDSDPTDREDRGEVKFDPLFEPGSVKAQEYILELCADIRTSRSAAARKVASPTANEPYPVMCFLESFRDWAVRLGYTFPIPDPDLFMQRGREFMASDVLPGQVGYAAGKSQYEVWKPYVYAEGVSTTAKTRFVIIEVATTIDTTTDFDTGIATYEAWVEWLDEWLLTAPEGMKSGFVADRAAFHYFYLQKTILREAFAGIFLSMLLAFVVLTIATGNYIVAGWATLAILLMVVQVIGFTVIMGWKLGVMEAIVYVMVVGLTVDYVVHLSDAYLECGKQARGDRVRQMLAMLGLSIVSGAVSTLGSSFFLLVATVVFFWKFGAVIFFVISLALVTSLGAFAALMDWRGPEHNVGNITIGATLAQCFVRMHESFWLWMADKDPHRDRLEEKVAMLSHQLNELRLRQTAVNEGDLVLRDMEDGAGVGTGGDSHQAGAPTDGEAAV